MTEIGDRLKNLQKPDLQIVARKLSITNRSRMSKQELVEAIQKCDESLVIRFLEISWWDRHIVLARVTWASLLVGVLSVTLAIVLYFLSKNSPTPALRPSPVVKLTMPGKHHSHSNDGSPDRYAEFETANFYLVELGTIRNFGPGPVYKLEAKWFDIEGTNNEFADIKPTRDLAEGESALLFRPPGYLLSYHETRFRMPGYIEFRFLDQYDRVHKRRQYFLLDNFPDAERQLRTVLYLFNDDPVDMYTTPEDLHAEQTGHVHIR